MSAREWLPGSGTWTVGERCTWVGVTLVCCRRHYAGERAVHPWDPAAGWSAVKAATLWAPDGDVEEARLIAAVAKLCEAREAKGAPRSADERKLAAQVDRLSELMCHITRGWATEDAA